MDAKNFIQTSLRNSLIKESYLDVPNIPNSMNLWHGGNLNDFNETISQKNGRYEFGPGLYLTTHYGTAKKYAKGSRKLYLINVFKGTDINDATLPINVVIDFIKKFIVSTMRNTILSIIEKYNNDGKIKASIFNNIILNHKAIKASNTKYLRYFYINNGIDYELVFNPFGWGETMMVLFNMNKINKYIVVKPTDKIETFNLKNEFN